MKKLLLYFILCLCYYPVRAQNTIHTPGDDLIDHVNDYFANTTNHALIYNGREEVKYPVHILNHPYLDTPEFRKGTLSFDGVIYPEVNLRLNTHTDELIVATPNNRFNIVLPGNRVDFATIDSLFICYADPSTNMTVPFPEGYYVRIYGGKYEVWKRQTMFLESKIRDMVMTYSFISRRKLYLFKDGVYHPFSSKNSVLKLFDSSKRKELKRFIKQHKLNFKRSPETAIVALLNYYEILDR